MIRLAFFPSYNAFHQNGHNINTNPVNAIFINSNGGAIEIKKYILKQSTNVGFVRGSNFANCLKDAISEWCSNGDSQYGRPVFSFAYSSPSELADIINVFDGFQFNFAPRIFVTGAGYQYIGSFAFNFVNLSHPDSIINTSGSAYLSLTGFNPAYYYNNGENTVDMCNVVSVGTNISFSDGNNGFGQYDLDPYNQSPPVQCNDLRSSGAQQMLEVDFTGKALSENVHFHYSFGFNTPSASASNVSVSIPTQMQASFTELTDCQCFFSAGVVRGDGVLKVYGHLKGSGVTANSSFIGIDTVNEEILICQFGFESCCDDANTCSITYNDNLEEYLTSDVFNALITIDRLEYSGFEALTDFCCDDVDCDIDTFEFEPNTTVSGGSGGGDNVDITCICDNLLLIKSAIESNGLKLDGINQSIDGLQIGVDTTNLEDKLDSINTTLEGYDCICENLEDIKDSIDNLELSPTINTPVTNNFSPTTNVSAPNVTNNVPVPSVNVNTDLSTINSSISNLTYLSNLVSLSNLSSMSNLQSLSDLSYMSNLSELGQIDTGIANGTVDISGGIDDIKLGIDLLTDALDNLQMPSVDMSAFECDGVSIACILDEIDKKLAVTEPDSEQVKTITQVIAEKELNYHGGDTEVIIEDGMFADVTRKVYEKKILTRD